MVSFMLKLGRAGIGDATPALSWALTLREYHAFGIQNRAYF
jgi:hypothetical protein